MLYGFLSYFKQNIGDWMRKEQLEEILRNNTDYSSLRSALEAFVEEPKTTLNCLTVTNLEDPVLNPSISLNSNKSLPFGFEDIDLEDRSETWNPESDDKDKLSGKFVVVKSKHPKIGRYDDLGSLGFGGMGEVRKICDSELNRKLAMKIIHPNLLGKNAAVARFVEEGQICAQLQHPNIVPVHEIGQLDDGRLYFTMKEIKGREFGEAIKEVHGAIVDNRWEITETGWSFRRLIDVFYKCCQAISYAHSRGVIHRDLKPENIMLGEYGEVLVVDWGIAKILGRRDYVTEVDDLVETERFERGEFVTKMGQVAGTPAYMAPEQARGSINQLDARTDIYALGATLYEILTGQSPYTGSTGKEVLQQVLSGPPPPVRALHQTIVNQPFSFELLEAIGSVDIIADTELPLPKELIRACEKAMSRERDDRYQTVTDFAKVLSDWLDGAKKREQALKVVEAALELDKTRREMRARANVLLQEAENGLKGIKYYEVEERKAKWWKLEEEAQRLTLDADLLQIVQEQKLQGALTHKADLEEAHLELAKRYQKEHHAFEFNRKMEKATKTQIKLKEHVSALPDLSPDKSIFLAYLKGTGAMSIHTDVDGVDILLEKFVSHNKRMIVEPIARLGNAPLRNHPLQMGSYRLRLQKKGYHDVLYPILISRGEHWETLNPFGEQRPIHIPKFEEIDQNECFIPAGWFWAGGDPKASYPLSRKKVWIDDFAVQKFSVTNREYIEFLNDLEQQGHHEEVLRYVPRERAGHANELGAIIYGKSEDGSFTLVPDADGDLWDLDWPVIMVDWFCAMAYADWKAERTGINYRLLHGVEWEKAARGVDGRLFPWGDGFDPSYSCMHRSHQKYPLPVVVDSFPIDESVYGCRGMAGNNRDWCLNLSLAEWSQMKEFEKNEDDWLFYQGDVDVMNTLFKQENISSLSDVPQTSPRVVRGGFFSGSATQSHAASRVGFRAGVRYGDVGFRIGYSIS